MTKTDLRRLRRQLNRTQVQLAADLGVQPTTLARWEQGRNPIPPLALTALRLLGERAGLNLSTSVTPTPFPVRRRRAS
jgi:transcriptional regulator with XRE-family HTH domain